MAYRVIGEGPIDLVYVAPFTNLETRGLHRSILAAIERMASFARVILFDRRGTGVSDPIQIDRLQSWERWADDLRAVLDAVGASSPALLAEFQAGQWAMLFAATYPARTSGLVLWNSFARSTTTQGYPHGLPPEVLSDLIAGLGAAHGTVAGSHGTNPSLSDLDHVQHAWYLRTCLTPARFETFCRFELASDVRHVLPSIQAPTLVMQRAEHAFLDPGAARYIADHVPGARYLLIPGQDSDLWAEGAEGILDHIEEFLTGAAPEARSNRVLATILFTDLVGSTERAEALGDRAWRQVLDEHDRLARAEIQRWRGQQVKSTGDGMLATFDSPTRGVLAAIGLRNALHGQGVEQRAGLHTGEIELRGSDIGGLAVHIAARVSSLAGPGEVLASRTVKDLVVGSGLTFVPKGAHRLKGVEEPWDLFAVSEAPGSAPIARQPPLSPTGSNS